jgi:histidinol-phosphate phosphatase family protein
MKELTAIIIAGGKGTRSADPKLPKVLQRLDSSVSILDLHIENIRKLNPSSLILALGHGSSFVLEKLSEISESVAPAELLVCVEDEPLGTAGALNQALKSVNTKNVLIIYGDTAIRTDYVFGFENWKRSMKLVGVYCHPNLHPEDSDTFSFMNGYADTFSLKSETKKNNSPLKSLTGSFFAETSYLSQLLSGIVSGDITENVYLRAWSDGMLAAIRTSDFFMDTGTPSRLNLVRNLYMSGSMMRRSSSDSGVIFLDRDNCFLPDIPTGRKTVSESDFEINTIEEIKAANLSGVKIFLVTNQPAISKGFMAIEEFESVQAEIEAILARYGAYIDDYVYCVHHPEVGHPGEITQLKINCQCRKPKIGMITSLSEFHQFDASKSIVIGDSPADLGLGINIGSKVRIVNYGDGSTAKAIRDYVDSAL